MMTMVVEAVFWSCVALIAYAYVVGQGVARERPPEHA